jgi:predicted permease
MDRELDEELRFHLDMETARLVKEGVPEPEARLAARRAFGGTPHRDAARDARGVRPVNDFLQDFRVAARTLVKQRGFAVVAILTLALGIGATTGLGMAVYRVLLQPYPFAEADRLVAVNQFDRQSGNHNEFSPANYLDLKQRSRSFDLLAAAEPWSVDWIGPDGPERFDAALVTADAFPIQGLTPLRGRAFLPGEFIDGQDRVVLLSEVLWRTRFGASETLVGSTLVLDSIPRVVIGVMPEDALQPYAARVWLPRISRPDDVQSRTSEYWTVMGRLAPGVTLEKARSEVGTIAARLRAEYPSQSGNLEFSVRSLREAFAGNSKGTLLVLFGAVSFVLFIACVNVTALQLAESVRRRREFAVRAAIGAGRGRLIRQLLTENLLIALTGALAGLVLAYWGIATIRNVAPDSLWQLRTLRFDGTAVLAAFGLAGIAALATALVPVLALGRLAVAQPLGTANPRAGISRARTRANGALVIAEVSLALVLLVGAGLLFRSLATLLQVNRGFRTDNVLVATVQLWSYYPNGPARSEFVRGAVERLEALPGIERAGMTSSLPLAYPIGNAQARVAVEGQAVAADQLPSVHTAAITPGYLEALDIPVLEGRSFTAQDIVGAPLVVLVNQAFVRRFLSGAPPLGQRLRFGFMGGPLTREIVGVVGDVRHDGLHQVPEPSVLVPHPQAATGAVHLVLRTTGDPGALERPVRAELARMNGAMPLSGVTTMDAQLIQSLRQRRFQLGLLGAFAATALLLAAIGIYGVMSRTTSERTHEIGLRMAVGAQAGEVRWMVLRGGGWLAGLGIALGAGAAIVLTRSMTGMLFGISALDPISYLAAGFLLLGVALFASWLPALRASRVDPVIALRSD